jgi:hypothetical protein
MRSDPLVEVPKESRGFKPVLRISIALNRSCALSPRPITRSLVCKREWHTPFRKPLQFIVTAVTLPISSGFVYDGPFRRSAICRHTHRHGKTAHLSAFLGGVTLVTLVTVNCGCFLKGAPLLRRLSYPLL